MNIPSATLSEDAEAREVATDESRQSGPQLHQLYRHFNKDGALLYVGISYSAIHRLSQHRDHSHWYEEIASVTIENFATREELIAAERKAITVEAPLHNLHRYGQKIQEIKSQAQEVSRGARISAFALTDKIVTFQPFYTVSEAAKLLRVRPYIVEGWMDAGSLSYVETKAANPTGKYSDRPAKIHRRVTGWQLIYFIEQWEKNGVPDA